MPPPSPAHLDPMVIEPTPPDPFGVNLDQVVIIHGDGFVEQSGGVAIDVGLVKNETGVPSQSYPHAPLTSVSPTRIKLTVPARTFTLTGPTNGRSLTVTVTNPGAFPSAQVYFLTFSTALQVDCEELP